MSSTGPGEATARRRRPTATRPRGRHARATAWQCSLPTNQSTLGPTAGYMYVAAVKEVEGQLRSRIVVFDHTGEYVGQIDTTQSGPTSSGPERGAEFRLGRPRRNHPHHIYPGGGFDETSHAENISRSTAIPQTTVSPASFEGGRLRSGHSRWAPSPTTKSSTAAKAKTSWCRPRCGGPSTRMPSARRTAGACR